MRLMVSTEQHLLCEVFLKFWWSEAKSTDGATIQAGQPGTWEIEDQHGY